MKSLTTAQAVVSDAEVNGYRHDLLAFPACRTMRSSTLSTIAPTPSGRSTPATSRPAPHGIGYAMATANRRLRSSFGAWFLNTTRRLSTPLP